MTEALIYVAGIGVTAIIFAIILYFIKDEHPYLRFFMVMILLTLALMMSKTFWDARTVCDTVVANSTIQNTNITSYEYKSFCFTTDTNTPGTFQTVVYWSYYVMIGYIILWLLFKALMNLIEMRKRG